MLLTIIHAMLLSRMRAPQLPRLVRGLCSSAPAPPPELLCATTERIPGHKVTAYLGLVEGSTVRTKNMAHDVFASVRQVLGGELTSYTDLLKEARQEAMERMNEEAVQRGANAVIGIRITSSSVTAGASEILSYGTAVLVEKE